MTAMRKFGILCLMLMAFLAFAVEEEEKPAEEKTEKRQQERELSVTADNMTLSLDKHLIELDGNVLVENDTIQLTAKKMLVHLDEKNKLKNIEAIGDVRVQKIASTESATGETGYYDAATKLITLRGNCVVMRGNDVMKGQTVIFDSEKQSIQVQRPTISLNLGKEGKDGENGEDTPLDPLEKLLK